MIKVILCAHGNLAIEMKASVEMVFGKVNNVFPLSFSLEENREVLIAKMTQLLDSHEWIILVDLQGGSPYNAAVSLAFSQPQIEVVTGMSLPLCLELVTNQDSLSLPQLVEHLLDVGNQCVNRFDKNLTIQTEEDF